VICKLPNKYRSVSLSFGPSVRLHYPMKLSLTERKPISPSPPLRKKARVEAAGGRGRRTAASLVEDLDEALVERIAREEPGVANELVKNNRARVPRLVRRVKERKLKLLMERTILEILEKQGLRRAEERVRKEVPASAKLRLALRGFERSKFS
jgi:hypothetical protein